MTRRRNISKKIYSFKKYTRFDISGRGTIFAIDAKDHPEVRRVKVKDKVWINGLMWEVTGIEISMKLMDPPFPGDGYGLVVRPAK